MISQHDITFTNVDDKVVSHHVIQVDNRFEAFYFDQSIGIYSNLDDAANAVRWLAMLVEWKPDDRFHCYHH